MRSASIQLESECRRTRPALLYELLVPPFDSEAVLELPQHEEIGKTVCEAFSCAQTFRKDKERISFCFVLTNDEFSCNTDTTNRASSFDDGSLLLLILLVPSDSSLDPFLQSHNRLVTKHSSRLRNEY